MTIDIKSFTGDPLSFVLAINVPTGTGVKRFREVIQPFQRERFELLCPSILAVARNELPPNGRIWIEGAKGSAKSMDLAIALIWLMAFSQRPLLIQAGAGDQGQSDELRMAIRSLLRVNPFLEARLEVQRDRVVSLDNQGKVVSELQIITTDALSTHGSRPDVVVLNEATHCDDEEFAATLFDNLSKMPHGLGIVLTNSGLLGSWQHVWKKLAVSTPDVWRVHEVKVPPPWISAKEIEQARLRNSHARFMRLYYGVWSSGSGDALDQADIEAAIDLNLRPMIGTEPGWRFVGGLDLGIRNDHSAVIVLGYKQATMEIRLAESKSWAPDPVTGQVDLMEVERYLLAMHQRFKLRSVAFDPWQAVMLSQRLTMQSLPMVEIPFTGKNLTLMATNLLEVFRSRRILMFHDPQLIDDLGRLQIEEKSYGHRLTATRDASGHADKATGLALAIPQALEQMEIIVPFVGAVDVFHPKGLGETPLQRALDRLADEQREREEENELLSGPDWSMPAMTFLGQ